MRQSFDDVTGVDQRARDAAIAAMGQRLAAGGLRTRQRVTQRTLPNAAVPGETLAPLVASSPILVADRSQAFVRDVAPVVPPSPRRRALTAIGRAAALASMASAGFALVLFAQNPRWSAVHRAAAPKAAAKTEIARDQPPALPDLAEPAIPPAQLADNTASSPVPIAAPAPATLPAASVGPAIQPPPAATPVVSPPRVLAPKPSMAPRLSRPLQIQLAAFTRPKPVQMTARHESVRAVAPPRPVVLVHYTLPRWLTEARDVPRQPLIMSPPPHELVAPAQVASRVWKPPVQLASSEPTERSRPVLPPLPRPRLIYASASYAPPAPYRGATPYAGYDAPAMPPAPWGYQPPQPYAP